MAATFSNRRNCVRKASSTTALAVPRLLLWRRRPTEWRLSGTRAIFRIMENDLQQVIQQGRQAFERRNYAEALASFRQVLDQNPNFADIRHLAGLCLSFLGQNESAVQEFDAAVRLNDKYVEAHLNRAIVLTE